MQMIKSFEEFQALGKDGIEAYVASATALTKGFQTIAQETADFTRKSFEKGTAAFERASATKSFDKALEVQQGYAKEAYEAFVAQFTKIGELYVATAQEAYKPLEASFKAFGITPAK
jgi:hypothetical protein